ncbi:helix-turn-helix transcriptional regulator [Longispora fulva]|uniref:Putative ATPase/DNA-binding CsgD family transcriptional regulator n=1 Tax=Longispora fulva TaxID=619741 RepID=A0A8J7KKA6_9ACTN|nr:LuxR C-terminal-related transcriptional regulator [Longispora fulva]MBG6137839.1 putative ATPase/DNA-binding CsgD family transcriptional regulator [Longispora fulva]
MPNVHHLPPELSSFVGRGPEFAAVGAAVAPGRLVTLAGPGGCGKTRLAMRAAVGLADRWVDGAWWVDLAGEVPGGDVVRIVAGRLGVLLPDSVPSEVALAHGLRDRTMLVVLDNCEHLLAEVAPVVEAVLGGCPGVALLATSRAPVGVAGEVVWRVPPMSLADALDLFLDRSGHPGVTDAAEERVSARRVCDRLDRLPLALELAAAWAGTLATAQIADSLADPFPLLSGGPRTAPFRQRTLAESMRWSHDLLDADERALFRRLAVFEPGYAATEAVALAAATDLTPGRVLPALRGLIDKSLVIADTTGPVARYRMLGVVRAYARGRLDEAGETDDTRDRHLGLFLALAEAASPLLATDKDAWRARIGAEYPNIRAALAWGLARPDPEAGRRLAVAVAWLWHLENRGHEGLALLSTALSRGDGHPGALQARILVSLALVADTTDPHIDGYAAADDGAAMAEAFGDPATARLGHALGAVGAIARGLDAARDAADRTAREAHAAGDAFVAEACAMLLGMIHVFRDEYPQARAILAPAVEGLLTRGDRGVAVTGLSWLAVACARSGELDHAAELAERAVAAASPLHDVHRLGTALGALAEIRGLQGRFADAAAALDPIERITGGPGSFVPGWDRTVGQLALWTGDVDRAVARCRREAAPLPDTQLVLATALRLSGDPVAAGRLLDRVEEVARAAGMPRLHAGALAQRAELVLPSDPAAALDLQHEALRLRAAHQLTLDCVDSLEALARLALRRSAPEVTAVLSGAADRARSDTGYAARTPPAPAPEDVARTAGDAYDRGAAMTLAEAVAYAARARGPRQRPVSGWGSLTPTEASVVELAVEGLSNPEIAARLFMSRSTVKTHLAHVYEKLQVANRTELARAAGHRGTP